MGASFAKEPDISRVPPEEWKHFESDLATVDELKKLPKVEVSANRESPSVELLCEDSFTKVSEDGSALIVNHHVARLEKESSLESFSTETIWFKPSTTRIHILRAQTILPDGKVIAVDNKAIFLEEVRGDSDILFDDKKKVRVVFPSTGVGAIIELVYVREIESAVSSHFSRTIGWKRLEPIRRRRFIIDVPKPIADQLIWDSLKMNVEPVVSKSNGEWERHTWSEIGISPIFPEAGMPSIYQRGPFLRVGFDGGWKKFGDWFGSLLSDGDSESAAIEEISKEWAEGAETPFEIADQLLRNVSTEVRYTGLEFGDGAYRPRLPGEVLNTKYGDCKDKSNLLRVLLKKHGIKSRIVLLQSVQPGIVRRKIASPGLFDHAILAVALPDSEELLFCDPTQEGVPLGFVSPRDLRKNALLVDTDGSLEWTTLPENDPTHEILSAELTMEPTGAFSGWFELKVDGAVGHYLNHLYGKFDRAERGRNAVSSTFRFVRGMEIVDSESVEDSDFPFHHRFYAIQNQSLVESSEKTAQYHAPLTQSFVTPVGSENSIREHSFLIAPIKTETHVKIKIPEEWEVLDFPKRFEKSSENFEFLGEWSEKKGGYLHVDTKMARIAPEFRPGEFRKLGNEVRAFIKWGMTAALLRKGGDDGDDWGPDPEALPRMPSAEGYAVLVNERWPLDPRDPYSAEHELRGVAFTRMGELYPKTDSEAQFLSRHMGAASKLFNSVGEETKEVATEMREIIEEFEGKVSPQQLASSEIVLAAALMEAGELDLAEEIAERIFKAKEVPEVFREASAMILAMLTAIDDPEGGAELCRIGLRNQLTPEEEWGVIASLYLYCEAVKEAPETASDRISAALDWLLESWPDREESILEQHKMGPMFLMAAGYPKHAKTYAAHLRDESEEIGMSEDEMEEMDQWEKDMDAVRPLHRKLEKFLADNPWEDLAKVEEGDVFQTAVDSTELYLDDSSVHFRYILRGMSQFGPQSDFSDRLYELHDVASIWFDQVEQESPPEEIEAILDLTLKLWKKAPETLYTGADSPYEFQSSIIERRTGSKAAADFNQSVYEDESLSLETRAYALGRVSDYRAEEGDIDGSIDALQRLIPLDEESYWRSAKLLEGGYAALANGHVEKAWVFFETIKAEIEASDEDTYQRQAGKTVSLLCADKSAAQAWWEKAAVWWPEWVALAKQMKISEEESALIDEDFWRKPNRKNRKKALKLKSEKKRKKKVEELLVGSMNYLRWHEAGSEDLIEFIHESSELFPQSGDALVALTAKIRK